jgi:hypothetical protein
MRGSTKNLEYQESYENVLLVTAKKLLSEAT